MSQNSGQKEHVALEASHRHGESCIFELEKELGLVKEVPAYQKVLYPFSKEMSGEEIDRLFSISKARLGAKDFVLLLVSCEL